MLDSSPEQVPLQQVTCCLCAARTYHDHHHNVVLVSLGLVTTGRPGEYSRVGLVYEIFRVKDDQSKAENCYHEKFDVRQLLPANWQDYRRKETITLV